VEMCLFGEEKKCMFFRNKLVAALAPAASGAFAADTSGKILGTVKDPSGNLIPKQRRF